MQKIESFTSRWAFIFAALGMAIGAGNIWRFPRIAAQNGGGSFLIAWMFALFLWSLPIIILEFAMGRKARAGVIKAFGIICGRKFCWMGGFITLCTMAIMFYYSVVTGWCIKYVVLALKSDILHSNPKLIWQNFISGYDPLLFHFISISLAVFVVSYGIVKGIERINKILIPLLFILITIAATKAVFLPNSLNGLKFFFYPELNRLFDHKIWLEAISQSAWSVGPGWGLILTYAVYSRENEDIVANSIIIGLGNNLASLLAGIAVICTLFAFLPQPDALKAASAGNVGLTFIWLPSLFKKIEGAHLFIFIFFLSLSFAAFSSLIAMVELGVRVLMDMGIERRLATFFIGSIGFLLGVPSAINIDFLCNQDWVWGIGLLIGGFFVAIGAIKYGISDFRNKLINNSKNKINLGSWFDIIIRYVIPMQFLGLMVWWFYKAIVVFETDGWWNPFHKYSIGTCLIQWGILLLVLIIFNKNIAKRFNLKN